MDVLTDVLDRVRLKGSVLFHYELGRPWSLSLPKFPDAVFHYLSRGSASLALEDGRTVRMSAGDFVLVSRGEPHLLSCGGGAKPFPLLDLGRRPAHLGPVRHGGGERPISTMICGYFSLSRPSRIGVLEALPPLLHLRPENDGWLELLLQRMVVESAVQHPGQDAVLSRMTEVLFVEALRSWIKTLDPGEGGSMSDPYIGKALQLIHEQSQRPWTLAELGRSAGLGRSAFSARFTRLVGQPVHRYMMVRRMDEAALMLETSDDAIDRIAARVGYETTSAFSKAFRQHCGISPGRYRVRKRQ